MKKLTSISFIVLLLISQVSYWAIFSYQQYMAKQKARQQIMLSLSDDAFEVIVAEDNTAAIKWEEAGKEFYLNGNMYDVAKIKMMNGKTHLYCFNDKNEAEILVKKNNSLNNLPDNTAAEKKHSKWTGKIPLSDFNNSTNIILTYSVDELTTNKYLPTQLILPNGNGKVLAPPPRV